VSKLTNEQVREAPGGAPILGWKREHVTRAQLVARFGGHELKVFAAKRNASLISWEIRSINAPFAQLRGSEDGREESMRVCLSHFRQMLRGAIDKAHSLVELLP
jgi:hypothetical protein